MIEPWAELEPCGRKMAANHDRFPGGNRSDEVWRRHVARAGSSGSTGAAVAPIGVALVGDLLVAQCPGQVLEFVERGSQPVPGDGDSLIRILRVIGIEGGAQ